MSDDEYEGGGGDGGGYGDDVDEDNHGFQGKCLIYTDGKGGPEKGAFPIAKETQVMPSNNAPKKDMINRAFFIRTDQKIMYLVADTPQLRDIKMKELSLTIMHLFSDKKPEPGLKPAAASGTPQLTEEEKEQSRVQKLQQKKDASQQIAQAKATNSTELDLSTCGLADMPPQVVELSFVKSIILTNNKLSKLPNVSRMPQLEELDCSSNSITAIDGPCIEACQQMTSLNLSTNVLWAVSTDLCKITSLLKLDLRRNKIDSLPDAFTRLAKLEELYLAGNLTLKVIPKQIFGVTSLEILDLSLCGIQQLPPLVTQLTRLLDLNLSKNELKELPVMSSMSRLSVLNLSNNSLEVIPNSLGKCGLGSLSLNGNPLKDAEMKKEMAAGDAALLAYLRLQMQLEESKRELAPKVEVKKKELVYTPQLAKHHVGEMVLKLDELRRKLMLAQSLQEAVPIAQHVRAIKPEIERLRPTLTVEVTPAPVIYPTDEKLVALQKTAGAALRDIKNVMQAWHGVLDKVPPPPSDAFTALAAQVAFCRSALGFKDEPLP